MAWHPPQEFLERPLPGPLCRISIKHAKEIIGRGGKLMYNEIISKDGYAMGWLTKDQIKTLNESTGDKIKKQYEEVGAKFTGKNFRIK